MLKAAVFDLDGTLADTEPYQWRGWVEVLKPLGITLSKKEYFNYAGKTGTIVEAEITKHHSLQIEKGSLLEKKEHLLMDWFRHKPIELLPYARESVQFFKERGITVAVVSGGPRDEIILKLKRTGLYPLFETIVSRNDVNRGKPFPDIYLLGAKKLGLNPKDCVAFEDTQYGVESAKAAGMACLAVPNQFSVKQDFSKADGTFKTLKEAVEYCGRAYHI